jgi:ribosome-binding factor A
MRRPERLAEALKEEIAEVVGFELEDPRVQAAIVTDVVVAENLRDAKVYVVVQGDEAEINKAMKTLQKASVFVRQQVAMNLNLRHVPQLYFVRDTAEENVTRITEILDNLTSKGEFEERMPDEE